MTLFLAGLGMVFVIEGLVLALAPLRIDRILVALASLGLQGRRVLGLISVALGVALVAIARAFVG